MTLRFIVALVITAAAFGQSAEKDGIRVHVTPSSIPCEPGTLVFGMLQCAPVKEQGILVHVRAEPPWDFDEYVVEVRYSNADGPQSITKTVPVKYSEDVLLFDSGWRTVAFKTGRVQTGSMEGIVITSIKVSKSRTPVVITVGDTKFSGPP